MQPGDLLVACGSNGLHTNGYSLARNIVFDVNGWEVETHCEDFGRTWGEELLSVHRSYLGFIKKYRLRSGIRGFAHITGGGIAGNLVRILDGNISAIVRTDTIPEVPIFRVLQEAGSIDKAEMYRVFNMGVGLIAVCSHELAEEIVNSKIEGSDTWIIGEIVAGDSSDHRVQLK